MLHNARETMLEITVTGWRQDGKGTDQGVANYTLVEFLQPFEHHQKECLCPENQIDTHREHTPI
jgi:hypothetical protein